MSMKHLDEPTPLYHNFSPASNGGVNMALAEAYLSHILAWQNFTLACLN